MFTLPTLMSSFGVHIWAEFPRSLGSEHTYADLSIMFLALRTGSHFLANTTSDSVSHKAPAPHQTNSLPSLQRTSPEAPLRATVAKIMDDLARVAFLEIIQSTKHYKPHLVCKLLLLIISCAMFWWKIAFDLSVTSAAAPSVFLPAFGKQCSAAGPL